VSLSYDGGRGALRRMGSTASTAGGWPGQRDMQAVNLSYEVAVAAPICMGAPSPLRRGGGAGTLENALWWQVFLWGLAARALHGGRNPPQTATASQACGTEAMLLGSPSSPLLHEYPRVQKLAPSPNGGALPPARQEASTRRGATVGNGQDRTGPLLLSNSPLPAHAPPLCSSAACSQPSGNDRHLPLAVPSVQCVTSWPLTRSVTSDALAHLRDNE